MVVGGLAPWLGPGTGGRAGAERLETGRSRALEPGLGLNLSPH